jgi:hypothetical protein
MSFSPLHDACRTGDVGAAARALEAGEHVMAADDDGNTPMHIACAHGHAAVVRLLLSKCSFTLMILLQRSDLDCLRALHDDDELLTLFVCARYDCVHLVRAMIAQGCNYMLRSEPSNQSILHVAGTDTLLELLDRYVDTRTLLHVRDALGQTALYLQCERHFDDLRGVRRMLQLGADPNVRRADGRGILHCIGKYTTVDHVELLLSHGADPDLVAHPDSSTPLRVAIRAMNVPVALCLIQYCKTAMDTPLLCDACRTCDEELLASLLHAHARAAHADLLYDPYGIACFMANGPMKAALFWHGATGFYPFARYVRRGIVGSASPVRALLGGGACPPMDGLTAAERWICVMHMLLTRPRPAECFQWLSRDPTHVGRSVRLCVQHVKRTLHSRLALMVMSMAAPETRAPLVGDGDGYSDGGGDSDSDSGGDSDGGGDGHPIELIV